MSNLQLKATQRGATARLATEIEAELYGPGLANQHLLVSRHDLEKVFAQSGSSLLIDLEIAGGSSVSVIVRELQRDPIKNQIIHADFMQVDMKKPVTVTVGFTTEGKSHAISNMGGMLEKNLAQVKIVCLPQYLVKSLAVDLGKLSDLKSVIRVADLIVPEGVTVKNNPRDVIYSIAASRRAVSTEAKGDAAPAAGAKAADAKAPAAPAKKK
jgi:large subunit ribosomal protein L25